MLRHIVLAAGLLLMPAIASAQELSGTWVRDGARSDVVPDSMYWTVQVPGPQRGPDSNHVIQIERDGNTMRITDPARPLRVYNLDGSTQNVPTDTGVEEATIKVSAEGNGVVVERSQTYSGLPGSVMLNTRENWALGPDGNTLTLTTSRETPARQVTYTEVYTRRPAPGGG